MQFFLFSGSTEDVKKYGKIACNEDECFYCGACENPCPDDLIPIIEKEVKKVKEKIEEEIPQLSTEDKKKLNELNEKIQTFLSSPKIRYWIKDKKIDKISKEIKKVLK